jgi:hypothetical protein
MTCFGLRGKAAVFRRATAGTALIFLLLLTLTSDLHVHPGARAWIPSGGPLRMESSSASSPALPSRAAPCLACLHSRGHALGPCERILPERPVSISLDRPAGPPPPPQALTLPPTGSRAPPAC